MGKDIWQGLEKPIKIFEPWDLMEFLTRLTDLANLKEISRVMVLPLLCTAYIQQTGLHMDLMGYTLYISDTDTLPSQVLKGLSIFIGKVFLVWFVFYIIKLLAIWLHLQTKEVAFPILASLLLTGGIFGLTSANEIAELKEIKSTWFIAMIFLAFYFISKANEIDRFINSS